MGKFNAYEKITDTILARMEQGEIPWRKPWNAASGLPRNIRGTAYRGINVWLLGSLGYASPTFLTKKQAIAKGGNVRQEEAKNGCTVIFWKQLNVKDRTTGDDKRIPLLRAYTVFNVAQCDGVKDPNAPEEQAAGNSIDPIEAAAKLVEAYTGAPELRTGGGRACYSPSADQVHMPEMDSFETAEFYYSVLFHELGHSTGHGSRLNRDGIVNHAAFGDHTYAKEELVAEFTASFMCGTAGISQRETIDNSAAYLQSWCKKLRQDPKLLIHAAAQAQKAADWMQGMRTNEDYKRRQDAQKESK